jgi:hypothetical protein
VTDAFEFEEARRAMSDLTERVAAIHEKYGREAMLAAASGVIICAVHRAGIPFHELSAYVAGMVTSIMSAEREGN